MISLRVIGLSNYQRPATVLYKATLCLKLPRSYENCWYSAFLPQTPQQIQKEKIFHRTFTVSVVYFYSQINLRPCVQHFEFTSNLEFTATADT